MPREKIAGTGLRVTVDDTGEDVGEIYLMADLEMQESGGLVGLFLKHELPPHHLPTTMDVWIETTAFALLSEKSQRVPTLTRYLWNALALRLSHRFYQFPVGVLAHD